MEEEGKVRRGGRNLGWRSEGERMVRKGEIQGGGGKEGKGRASLESMHDFFEILGRKKGTSMKSTHAR